MKVNDVIGSRLVENRPRSFPEYELGGCDYGSQTYTDMLPLGSGIHWGFLGCTGPIGRKTYEKGTGGVNRTTSCDRKKYQGLVRDPKGST